MALVTRRGLFGLLAAPAIVSAANIMPVRAIERLILPRLYGDGIHCDWLPLQTLIYGGHVIWNNKIIGGASAIDFKWTEFKIENPLRLNSANLPFSGGIIHG